MSDIMTDEDVANSNELLRKLAEELKKNPPEDANGGHNALMQDLAEIVYEAAHYEFHDFKNEKYATPKVTLRSKLLVISENVVSGKYDN